MKILIEKLTNRIKMIVEGDIEYDNSIFTLEEVDDEDLNGYSSYYEDGKIRKEKITIEKEETLLIDKQKLSDDIDSAKTISDIKDILKDLL